MNRFIEERRKIRRRINNNKQMDRYLHQYITVVLAINMVLILFAMLSVTVRMSLSGVGLLDSMPIALYILPLMIFLPLMIRAFYQSRTAAWNFFFLIVASVFFSMLSLLVRGFIICVIFNIGAVVSIFILGRFRPKGSLKSAGKKGIAYIILMNMLGLTFPISIVVMGQVPITEVTTNLESDLVVSVPLADFDFPFAEVIPSTDLLANISNSDFGLSLRILEDDATSWSRLSDWLLALNETDIQYSVTLSANRTAFAGGNPEVIGTTEIIQKIYDSHRTALTQIIEELTNITNLPQNVLYDMTLSRVEWQKLMFHTRSLDLVGFTGLMRASIFSTDIQIIEYESSSLVQETRAANLSPGILIESFVIDDMQDSDNVAMRLSGVSIDSLDMWDQIEVSSSRSRFSLEMNGDVGEYLVESYSKSIGVLGAPYSIRIGEAGNRTDIEGRSEFVYETLEVLCDDITLVTGNGVNCITIESLPSLISSFGPLVLSQLENELSTQNTASATYTFRIYAYRAVFLAIDSFDLLML